MSAREFLASHQLKFARRSLLMLISLFTTSFSLASAATLVKQRNAPGRWYGSSDFSVTQWNATEAEGGGASAMVGVELGLRLSYGVTAFSRVSSIPEAKGLQDVRLGLSKETPILPNWLQRLSAGFSLPTSAASQAMQQTTQLSAAASLEYARSAWTLGLTAFTSHSYYAHPQHVPAAHLLLLKADNPGRARRNRQTLLPRDSSRRVSSVAEPDGAAEGDFTGGTDLALETFTVDRIDRVWGFAWDQRYQLNQAWALSQGAALSQARLESGTRFWINQVTLLGAIYSRNLLSLFANAGRLDAGPILHWPKSEIYTVGIVYSFRP